MRQSFSSVFPITDNKKLFEDIILHIFTYNFYSFQKKKKSWKGTGNSPKVKLGVGEMHLES